MKKLILMLGATLMVGGLATAEIALKDKGSGQVEITFTYKDDKASEMGVIGTLDNWTVPGEAMERNAAGLWEKTITALATDEIQYKFYSKGSWIFDERAPDKKDDGYGAFNGLIVVADILSGVTPAVPGTAPVVVAKAKGKPGRPKASFGTQTWVASDTQFDTTGGFAPTVSALDAYSLWKFQGDLIPNVPGYLELTAFNGAPQLYNSGTAAGSTKLEWLDGLKNLATGVGFNPFYYLGGNARPHLDKFRIGIETPWVNYETGYKGTILPGHQSVLWETVGAPVADSGYTQLSLGKSLQTWGDLELSGGVLPNFSSSVIGKFGLFSWLSASFEGFTADVAYELRSLSGTDPTQFLVDPARQDWIVGGSAVADGWSLKFNGLYSLYIPGTTVDLQAFNLKSAFQVEGGYTDYYGDSQTLVGLSYRGSSAANMLYVANNAVLGLPGSAMVSVKGFQNFGYEATVNYDASVVTAVTNIASNNIGLTLTPDLRLNLDVLTSNALKWKLDLYAQLASNTKGALVSLPVAGLVAHSDEIDLYYRWDASDTTNNVLFNSVLGQVRFGPLALQLGGALRTGASSGSPFGATAGLTFNVDAPAAKNPVLYSNFVYGMDPYASSSTASSFNLTNYGIPGGPNQSIDSNWATSKTTSALRIGLSWNF
ncbi:MAG: glycogen-binding domain-containing protein [Spirochaetales bacterium]